MEIVFILFLAAALGIAAYLIKTKGFVGAMLGGKVEKTYGEVYSDGSRTGNAIIKIHRINKKDTPKAVIEYSFSSVGAFQSTPIELNKSELLKLQKYINELASEI